MKKEILKSGIKITFKNKEFIFNKDLKISGKKSMFQILQNICFDATPAAYCSDLKSVPCDFKDFLSKLDLFLIQNEFKKVYFHIGATIQ